VELYKSKIKNKEPKIFLCIITILFCDKLTLIDKYINSFLQNLNGLYTFWWPRWNIQHTKGV